MAVNSFSAPFSFARRAAAAAASASLACSNSDNPFNISSNFERSCSSVSCFSTKTCCVLPKFFCVSESSAADFSIDLNATFNEACEPSKSVWYCANKANESANELSLSFTWACKSATSASKASRRAAAKRAVSTPTSISSRACAKANFSASFSEITAKFAFCSASLSANKTRF